MIPKVIHYCWFGEKPLPESAQKNIDSWKKFCPDYEIKQWSEDNYDVNKYKYTREAYQQKRYAFVTDVARLDIIYHEGGIYLDIDVELLKSLNPLLNNDLFLGMEISGRVATGLGFGAEKGHKILRENLRLYESIPFSSDITCVTYTTNLLKKYGLKKANVIQNIEGALILPTEYLAPLSYGTNRLKITSNTYAIHHYNGSWKNGNDHFIRFKIMLRKWISDELYEKIKNKVKR